MDRVLSFMDERFLGMDICCYSCLNEMFEKWMGWMEDVRCSCATVGEGGEGWVYI